MTKLSEYLNTIVRTSNSIITFSGDVNNYINRWLVKAQDADPNEGIGLSPHLHPIGRVISDAEIETLTQDERENNWRLYCPTDWTRYLCQYNRIQDEFELDHDKYIYAVASIYCRQEQEAIVFCASMSPTSVWINDQLVYTSSYDFYSKEMTCIYKFKKGINLILVEKPYFSRHKELRLGIDDFVISVKPYEYCIDEKENHFLDINIFNKMKYTYNIVQNRAVYRPEDKVEVFVLPRYITENIEKENISINVSDETGRKVTSIDTETMTKVLLDLDLTKNRMYKISVEVKDKDSVILDNYMVSGDLLELVNESIERARARADANEQIIDTIRQLVTIPNTKIGVINGSFEMMNSWLYHMVFSKIYEFIKYTYTPDCNVIKKVTDIHKTFIPAYHISGIDDENFFYLVILPKKYDITKKYPLVVFIEFGYGGSRYPSLKEYQINQEFEDAILINVCARGGINHDYINECNVFDLIEEVVRDYNIDRDRIYDVGICTGSMKGYGMAIENPGLFSVACAVNGTVRTNMANPDYEQLKNLETVSIMQINSVKDTDFNCSFVVDLFNHISSSKLWFSKTYSHEDFNESMHSNKLLKEILKKSRVRYPKKIYFTTKHAMFNRSHWILLDRIEDLNYKPVVEAELISENRIQINCKNVSDLSLLLNQKEMKLDDKIIVTVNGVELPITLKEYTRVIIHFDQEQITIDHIELSREQFFSLFDAIAIDESLMGIKQLYYRQCNIVYSSIYQTKKDSISKRLLRILTSPLRVERNRNYKYNKYVEDEIDEIKLAQSNLVYLASLDDTSKLQQDMIKSVNCQINEGELIYQDTVYRGDTAAIIKGKNPYNNEKNALLVIYNSDIAKKALLDIWDSFETNTLFYSDAIIYNNNQYFSFRDK